MSETTMKMTCKAHIKYCPWATHGDLERVRCPYTGVWIWVESEWVTLE